MDKKRDYAVLSDKNRKIYATHRTELQATRIVIDLTNKGVLDARVFNNGGNQLTRKKYDKYILDIQY